MVDNDPVFVEFMMRVLADRVAGQLRGVDEYLRLYPGIDAERSRAYLSRLDAVDGTISVITGSESRNSLRETELRIEDPSRRYELERRIGSGGMGEVFLARDRTLEREVAVKFGKDSLFAAGTRDDQLVEEALTAARLAHPNIPPVFDVGVDNDGRPFYVMQRIRGQSFAEVLEARVAHPRRWSLVRLLGLFAQACAAVGYAHSRGVVHLDLKPENIMLGENRDLYVLDWGLARRRGREQQQKGVIAGTPAYMSPEQARGEQQLDARSDVYSLAIVLREIVTGRRAYQTEDLSELVEAARLGQFVEGPEWDAAPASLREVCASGLALRRSDRLRTARELAEGVQQYLDGTREQSLRRSAAHSALKQARSLLKEQATLKKTLKETESRLKGEEPAPWASSAEKSAFWSLEDQRDQLRERIEQLHDEARAYLAEASRHAPDDLKVRRQIGRLDWLRFERAEQRGDLFQQRYYAERLRSVRVPEIDRAVEGHGELVIHVEPPAERARLHQLVERERRLRPVRPKELSGHPLRVIDLPMGRYQVTLERNGYRPIVAPIHIGRSETVCVEWRFRTEDEIGREFVQVPSGRFLMGGDQATLKAVERCAPLVAEFAVARCPVTFGDYIDFLRQLPPKKAAERAPRTGTRGELFEFVLVEPRVRLLKRSDGVSRARWPVVGISWHDAMAYARWRSQIDGRKYTLPSDREWEKAARGTDGRTFPWGDRFDASFCKGLHATAGKAQPEPVSCYPADKSPYGVRHCAGGVNEWCRSWYSRADEQKVLRGGYFKSPTVAHHHCAYRNGLAPGFVYEFIGFRLVHHFK